jgi:hypothetical protein
MEFILYVQFGPDMTFEIFRGFAAPVYSVFIVRDRPWGYRPDRLLW